MRFKTRLLDRLTSRAWIQANALLRPFGRGWWVDAFIILGLGAALFGLLQVAREWTGIQRPAIEIDLSPWALPAYTFFSMVRGLVAYVISLAFTLVYAYWAAHDRRAERLLVPLLDILQSVPVLGFMPGLVLAMVALFPRTNVGLELAAVIMIFTGQAWNMTFSLYHSLKSVPQDIKEASVVYRFTWWERFKWMELPYGTTGLVWNSMMSMAGGWFFLMITEAFRLGDKDFRLPGLGSYMSVAVEQRRWDAQLWAVLAMILMIVLPAPVAAGGRLGAALPGGGDHGGRDAAKLVPGLSTAVGPREAAPVLAPRPVASFGRAQGDPRTPACRRRFRAFRDPSTSGPGPGPRGDRLGRGSTRPPPGGASALPLGDPDLGGGPDSRAGPVVDGRGHGVGSASRSCHWTVADVVAGAPTGGAGHGILSGSHALPGRDRGVAGRGPGPRDW